MLYLLQIASLAEIDIGQAVLDKLAVNERAHLGCARIAQNAMFCVDLTRICLMHFNASARIPTNDIKVRLLSRTRKQHYRLFWRIGIQLNKDAYVLLMRAARNPLRD